MNRAFCLMCNKTSHSCSLYQNIEKRYWKRLAQDDTISLMKLFGGRHMTRDFKFETLQLHAGQVVDPATKSRAVPIIKQHPSFLMTRKKVPICLP